MWVVVYVHLPHCGLSIKLDCQLRNRWRQHSAWTAPRRPEIDQDRLHAVEDITGEMCRVERGVPGVFRGHRMLLALLWGLSIPCDGVCDRVQTAINGFHPIRRCGDGTSYLGTPFFWPDVGTLAAHRSQTPQRAEKKPLSVSEERLAAFHHLGDVGHTRLSR